MVKQKIDKIVRGDPHFRHEFKSQLRWLIILTLGFTIAFSWRQTIFDLIQAGVISITKIESTSALSILTSLAITIFAIILIYLTSRFLREKHNYY